MTVYSAADQAGQIFPPYVVLAFVFPLNQKQVDMMRAVSLLLTCNGTKPPSSPRHKTLTLIEGFCFSNFGTSLTARRKVRPVRLSEFSYGL